MDNKILIISYYANMPGACQAEWLDDKIDSIKKTPNDLVVLSSNCANKYDSNLADHWRIASFSITDFLDEKKRVHESNRKLRLVDWLLIPFVLSIGLVLDLLQYIFTKGIGEGRWSWTIPAFFATLFICVLRKPNKILSTGGPASAHLAAIIAGKLFRIPVIIELQDPLSGDGIGRNVQSRGWLYRVEGIIVRNSTKVVYVTNSAAQIAKEKFKSSNIVAVYPGAKKFEIKRNIQIKHTNKFRLVHLGSLYATRNFSSIISAIDKLIYENLLVADDIELINLGHVADHIQKQINIKSYVKILPPVSRIEALEFAANCDVTLLIQNSDDRSQVTIPYKTYDYLNLDVPIIALLNSFELTKIIQDTGHAAFHLSEIDKISEELLRLINNRNPSIILKSFANPVIQAQMLLNLSELS